MTLAVGGPIGWIGSMLGHPFMRHALVAVTGIALACGTAGYFLVVRVQVFVGDALSHVAFTGAAAALAAGIDLRVGLFAGTIAVALAMGLLGRQGRADDVVIGSVFAWLLGLGVLFLTIYTTSRSGANGTAGVRTLFGSVFGLSAADAAVALAIGAAIAVALLALARPLLFASVDPAVAAARGVPVGLLGVAFLGLVGAAAAETTQAVGALLLLGLLAAPGAAAARLTPRPFLGLVLSVALSVAACWGGLALSYSIAWMPPSFAIIALATLAFTAATGVDLLPIRRLRPPSGSSG